MNEPGKIQQVGIEGLTRISHHVICGGCQSEHVTLGETDRVHAGITLVLCHGWGKHQDLGWICPSCCAFAESIPARYTDDFAIPRVNPGTSKIQ